MMRWINRVALTALLIVMAFAGMRAQTRYSYLSGQSMSPAFEGWWENADGSFTLFFGYMNSNWSQEFDIPVGPENNLEPGGPDQGQPTHFYPRRNPFLFTVHVPKDFGRKELIWTLTANGKTERAYASLNKDYAIDKQVISTEVGGDLGSLRDALRTNLPPELKVEGDKQRHVAVGATVTLIATARDPETCPSDGSHGRRHRRADAVGADRARGKRRREDSRRDPPCRHPHRRLPPAAARVCGCR